MADVSPDYGVRSGRYCEIIEDLYPKVKDAMYLNTPLPEVFTRLARIRAEQGKYDEARNLFLQAKDFLAQRIASHPFFGDLNIMRWLEEDLYRLPFKPAPDDFDLYDLFTVLQKPACVRFFFGKQEHVVSSVMEDGECVIRFEEKWYRNVDDFFTSAAIEGKLLTNLYREFYGWEVQRDAD